MPDVNLYDANGGYVGTASLAEVPTSDHSIMVGSSVYVWDSRNSRFRATGPSIAGKMVSAEPEADEKRLRDIESKMIRDIEDKMLRGYEDKSE